MVEAMKITREQLAEAARKHWDGWPMSLCAREAGIGQDTLTRYFKLHGLPIRNKAQRDRELSLRAKPLPSS